MSFTPKTYILCLPTTSQVPPVWFSLDSEALNFRPIWGHGPSLKHCGSIKPVSRTVTALSVNSSTAYAPRSLPAPPTWQNTEANWAWARFTKGKKDGQKAERINLRAALVWLSLLWRFVALWIRGARYTIHASIRHGTPTSLAKLFGAGAR